MSIESIVMNDESSWDNNKFWVDPHLRDKNGFNLPGSIIHYKLQNALVRLNHIQIQSLENATLIPTDRGALIWEKAV